MLGDVGPAVGFILVGAALIYFLVVWLIADYASKKGHSLVAFLLLGLFISPIISLIAALLVEDKRIPRSPVPVAVDRFDREDHLDRLKKPHRAS